MLTSDKALMSKKTEGDYPCSPGNIKCERRDSAPFTVASASEDPAHTVAKQIREKAGSSEIRLNEDSNSSVDNREVHATGAM